MSKRKSGQFHHLAGSFRPERHAKGTLRFPPATGTAPRWLSKLAKAEWRRVAPLLLEAAMLLETDTAILGSYCTAYAGFLECKALVEKQGHIVKVESQTRTGSTSKPIRNPAVTLMLDYQRAMLAAAAKLGFSPFDRERIEATESSDDEEQGSQRGRALSRALSQPSAQNNGTHGDAHGPFIKFPNAAAGTDDDQ